MNQIKKKMIADIIKENRNKKGLTQKELSDISKISLRSIQRIENGEVVPRMYTLKTLAESLNFSLDFLNEEENIQVLGSNWNKERRLILSLGCGVLIFFLAWAYLAQSSRFPETGFEFLLYCACMVGFYTLILLWIWRPKS